MEGHQGLSLNSSQLPASNNGAGKEKERQGPRLGVEGKAGEQARARAGSGCYGRRASELEVRGFRDAPDFSVH